MVAVETREALYYVTALSNLVRGYDKYRRAYDKRLIPESTFKEQFFLLSTSELNIGIEKASRLLRTIGLPGDCLLILETHAGSSELQPNLRTGRGRFLNQTFIAVDAMYFLTDPGSLTEIRVEEACALSLRIHLGDNKSYAQLAPRSVSILPVANACQARCPFCFSKASVSSDVRQKPVNQERVGRVLGEARERGARRAVITGGGEPTLLADCDLSRLVREASYILPEVVLISNGFKWGSMDDRARSSALRTLDEAGLSVLSISRHHCDPARNATLMNLDTRSEEVSKTWVEMKQDLRQLRMRWICVLQRGGVANRESLEQYLDWAVHTGVEEICFKELYVSTSSESEYYDRGSNAWSARNQVSLSLIVNFASESGWSVIEKLPWGAPIYEGYWQGRRITVAAYTEPSVYWELANGVCRSWNLMADGRCLASLEDRRSEVLTDDLRRL